VEKTGMNLWAMISSSNGQVGINITFDTQYAVCLIVFIAISPINQYHKLNNTRVELQILCALISNISKEGI
jgi:hypothetical protein